jgi:hypothetical protein
MIGVQYVTNDKGEKVAVLIDLKRYGELVEDMMDVIIADSRRHEKSIPFDDYIAKRRKRKKGDV